jgi:hypothetical protein
VSLPRGLMCTYCPLAGQKGGGDRRGEVRVITGEGDWGQVSWKRRMTRLWLEAVVIFWADSGSRGSCYILGSLWLKAVVTCCAEH